MEIFESFKSPDHALNGDKDKHVNRSTTFILLITAYGMPQLMKRFYIYLGSILHDILPPLRFNKTPRVRVVVTSHDGYILLVRNWFGYQNWSLPGGGVKKTESPKQAAARELLEETGIQVAPHSLKYLGTYPCNESKNSFHAKVYYVILQRREELAPADLEIIETRWYSLQKLPENLGLPLTEIGIVTR